MNRQLRVLLTVGGDNVCPDELTLVVQADGNNEIGFYLVGFDYWRTDVWPIDEGRMVKMTLEQMQMLFLLLTRRHLRACRLPVGNFCLGGNLSTNTCSGDLGEPLTLDCLGNNMQLYDDEQTHLYAVMDLVEDFTRMLFLYRMNPTEYIVLKSSSWFDHPEWYCICDRYSFPEEGQVDDGRVPQIYKPYIHPSPVEVTGAGGSVHSANIPFTRTAAVDERHAPLLSATLESLVISDAVLEDTPPPPPPPPLPPSLAAQSMTLGMPASPTPTRSTPPSSSPTPGQYVPPASHRIASASASPEPGQSAPPASPTRLFTRILGMRVNGRKVGVRRPSSPPVYMTRFQHKRMKR